MNDMTPLAIRLTAKRAEEILEKAGAKNVSVVGRGRMMLAIFQVGRKAEAWIVRADGWVANFERDVHKEFSKQ